MLINEIADKLKKNEKKMSVTLQNVKGGDIRPDDLEELKQMLFKIEITEEQAAALISRLEQK